jgi:hypothetical protein
MNRDDFYRPQEQRYKGIAGEKPVVGKVLLSSNDDSFLVVKTLVRHVRCVLYHYISRTPALMLLLRGILTRLPCDAHFAYGECHGV